MRQHDKRGYELAPEVLLYTVLVLAAIFVIAVIVYYILRRFWGN
jgi:hypothetical protein